MTRNDPRVLRSYSCGGLVVADEISFQSDDVGRFGFILIY